MENLDNINDPTAQGEKTGNDNRICVISIIVSDLSGAEFINATLSSYGKYIIGRMGVTYKEKNVSVISVALDGELKRGFSRRSLEDYLVSLIIGEEKKTITARVRFRFKRKGGNKKK